MKIEAVESFHIGTAYVVRIRTDSGLTGIGQTACWAYPEAVERIVDTFRGYLIGQDPLRIEHHWQLLYRMGPFRGAASGLVRHVRLYRRDGSSRRYLS